MKKLVVIDTETGGLDPSNSSILTLGAAFLANEEIHGEFAITINEPELQVTPKALEVNGLDAEQIARWGVTPSFAVTAFESWLRSHGVIGRATLAGHNIAGFDMGFLKRLYRLAEKRMPFDYHVLDTMSVALFLKHMGKLDVPNVKLDTLCQHFGIKIREDGAPHNSVQDAVATAKLLVELTHLIEGGTHAD